jgi:integrase
MFKDLGQRPIELTWLKVEDIDLTTGISNITGAKHTIGREGKLKTLTIELLKRLIKRDNLNAKSTFFLQKIQINKNKPSNKQLIIHQTNMARSQKQLIV